MAARKTPKKDTTKDQAPAPATIRGFRDALKLATEQVTLYAVDLTRDIEALEAEAYKPGADREAIAQTVASYRQEMDDNKLVVTLRRLTAKEFNTLMSADDRDDIDQLVAQTVSPEMTADDWRGILDGIDSVQAERVWTAANRLLLKAPVVPDFPAILAPWMPPES